MKQIQKGIISIGVVLVGVVAISAYAQVSNSDIVNAFRQYKDVQAVTLATPAVVEVSFDGEVIERPVFAVLDTTTNAFEPSFFKQEVIAKPVSLSINATPTVNGLGAMTDGDVRTYTNFFLPESTQGSVRLVVNASTPITSSGFTVLLGEHVALPTVVEVRAMVQGKEVIVVANQRMNGQTLRFPKTVASSWIISFTYGQPLRISELQFIQESSATVSSALLRFLAQPNHAYRIYFDADRQVQLVVGEAGNLSSNKDVVRITKIASQKNASYVIADMDGDTIPDVFDNCVLISNTEQKDANGNGRGDMCDDFDRDGVLNSKDNCPDNPNRDQLDVDADGLGDTCDAQESRITEQYAWLPWVGIGFAALVLIVLFAVTARSMKSE
ncbi:MAG: thrombospondin 3-like protein [uncultured bacterium]|uniref:Thrombospondin type 3 repeat-containing domain protein n=1 Tax=Candidatus Wolfebacteria bacterium GW2011_GWE2_44_13 TaxID=1619017 RepID=A0A0G1JIH7_9BACT|nr:MAG: thrombospondin 3-like protein [uncultured bacterium]KKT43787.1 MAG: Thrombospondin type 3 repeat-containing domain protein [Candidatus Wolfebacteria bacterium GW2011_GWE2_44_13]